MPPEPGYEQPVFLGVLAAAVAFEVVWNLARGTNAIGGGACAAPGHEVTGDRG